MRTVNEQRGTKDQHNPEEGQLYRTTKTATVTLTPLPPFLLAGSSFEEPIIDDNQHHVSMPSPSLTSGTYDSFKSPAVTHASSPASGNSISCRLW